jgi:hypothetical protein
MKQNRTGKPIQVYLPEGVKEQLDRLAEANGRTLKAEVLAALRRYLADPDVLRPGGAADAPAKAATTGQGAAEGEGPAEGPAAGAKGRAGRGKGRKGKG